MVCLPVDMVSVNSKVLNVVTFFILNVCFVGCEKCRDRQKSVKCLQEAETYKSGIDFEWPTDSDQLQNMCRRLDDLVWCVSREATNCFPKINTTRAMKLIHSAVQIELLCDSDEDWKTEILQDAPCLKAAFESRRCRTAPLSMLATASEAKHDGGDALEEACCAVLNSFHCEFELIESRCSKYAVATSKKIMGFTFAPFDRVCGPYGSLKVPCSSYESPFTTTTIPTTVSTTTRPTTTSRGTLSSPDKRDPSGRDQRRTETLCNLEEYLKCLYDGQQALGFDSLPVTQQELSSTCEKLSAMVDCVDLHAAQCFTPEQTTVAAVIVDKARIELSQTCDNQTYQEEYLKHAVCWANLGNTCKSRHMSSIEDLLVTPQDSSPSAKEEALGQACCGIKGYIDCDHNLTLSTCGSESASLRMRSLAKTFDSLLEQCTAYIWGSSGCEQNSVVLPRIHNSSPGKNVSPLIALINISLLTLYAFVGIRLPF